MNSNNKIRNVYLYVKKDILINCIKYGMKLSEYSNITFKIGESTKKGIVAYISPKDSDKYVNETYDILRIKTDDLCIYVIDKLEKEDTKNFNICPLNEYYLGQYMNPEIIICSTVLPEYIYKYNRIIDVPLLIDNSKDFYYNIKIEQQVENSFNDLTYDKLKSLS